MDGGELAHLARADDQNRAPLEVAEDFSGELDGGVADRHRALGKCGLRSHAFAGGKCRRKELVQKGAGAPQLRGDTEGLFDLPEYLGLAHHKRVEAGGNTVEVPHGFMAGLRVQVRSELVARDAMKLG